MSDEPIFDYMAGLDNPVSAELEEKYRHVFLSSIGREVLLDLLRQCYFGKKLDPNNKTEVVAHNMGVWILIRCGIFAPGMEEEVINALCAIPKRRKEK